MFGTLVALAVTVSVDRFLPPIEVVIDCSSWHGQVAARLATRFEARDGTVIESNGELPEGTDPSSPRTGLRLLLERHGWRFEYLDGYRVVVRGSKTSPIKRVTFDGAVWVPVVTRRIVLPPDRAPPPREK